MIITQDSLIRQIADREHVNADTVRDIFKSAEEIVFECLSSTAPSEHIVIRLFHGLNLERNYVDRKKYSKGMFQNLDCPAHVNVKAACSRYYSRKVNERLYGNFK